MGRECKHQWGLLDKKHIETGRTFYIFFCSKCLKFRKLSIEDYEKI